MERRKGAGLNAISDGREARRGELGSSIAAETTKILNGTQSAAAKADAPFKGLVEQPAADTSLDTDENAPNLKMGERPDWAMFRSIDGLQQKAGVPATRLRRLVLKEIADNALDDATEIEAGRIDGHDAFYVADNGPGLDGTPQEIAELFSIRRPMRSSKLLRLPQRGALGNGLRVVAGAVLASEGSLVVITRDQRIVFSPQADDPTTVVEVTPAVQPVGTRIEIGFGSALPRDSNPLAWMHQAADIAFKGKNYEGKTSPFWYDAVQFHELLLAHGDQPLRSLIAQFDGCTGGKAGEIVSAARLDRIPCERVNRDQATALLKIARKAARPSARNASDSSAATHTRSTTTPSSVIMCPSATRSQRPTSQSSSRRGPERGARRATSRSRCC